MTKRTQRAQARLAEGSDDTLEIGSGQDGASEDLPWLAAEDRSPYNAELQLCGDAVGTWLFLRLADGDLLPLTCFGPERAQALSRVVEALEQAGRSR